MSNAKTDDDLYSVLDNNRSVVCFVGFSPSISRFTSAIITIDHGVQTRLEHKKRNGESCLTDCPNMKTVQRTQEILSRMAGVGEMFSDAGSLGLMQCI